MKITFSIIFFNLLIFATTSDLIYDTAGEKLLKGLPYYILPLLRGTGGGLTLSQNTKLQICPLNITQEPFEVNNGVPFIFTPIILDEQFIRSSYPTSIEASVQKDQNPCHGSNIWKVSTAKVTKNDDDDDDDALFKNHKDHKKKKHDDDDDDDKKKKDVSIVTTGGEFNKPESCFQIVEDDMMPGLKSYQIQYCPFKCGSGSSSTVLTCYNVGLISDADGKKYLAPTDAIFPVVFTNSFGTVKPTKLFTKFSRLSAKVTLFNRSVK